MKTEASSSIRLQSVDDPAEWVEKLARFGYAAKGVVYLVVGILALRTAIGFAGALSGSQGALRTIAQQPFGQILLGLTAVGLLGYAVWQFVRAIKDPDREGRDAEGSVKRIGYAVSGIVYLGLAFLAGRIVLGGGGGGGNRQQTWTAELLSQPFGQWLVGAVGAVIIGVGLYHFYKAHKASFMRHYRRGEMSEKEWRGAKRLGQFGLAARGVTFCLIGGFFIQAAIQSDPDEARGLSAALETIASQPYGQILLGLVAVGFIAYAIYCFSLARYRRVNVQ